MEFSRFGGNITNKYWGCCACCIIQDFSVDPNDKASIQLVEGDGCSAILNNDCEQLYAGPTYRDIFWQRLRFGTFSTGDMPNHAFLAILTANQLRHGYGKQWLAILKEAGFEFIRTINNSVGTGPYLLDGSGRSEDDYDDPDDYGEGHPVHGGSANFLFGLFRNIGKGAASNPFQPPEEWLELTGGPEANEFILSFGSDISDFVTQQQEFHRKVWDGLPKLTTLLTEKQLREQNVPIWLSGRRVEEAKPKIKDKNMPKSKEVSLKGVSIASPVPPVAPTGGVG